MHRRKIRFLWGYFPYFLIPIHYNKTRNVDVSNKGGLRSWKRAKIPLCISRALGKAIKEILYTNK